MLEKCKSVMNAFEIVVIETVRESIETKVLESTEKARLACLRCMYLGIWGPIPTASVCVFEV